MKIRIFKKLICLLMVLQLVFLVRANAQSKEVPIVHQPVVILNEVNAWSGEGKRFAVYEDGLVIYSVEGEKSKQEYFSVTLNKEGIKDFFSELNIDDDFFSLKDRYVSFEATDQPEYYIYVKKDGKEKSVSVYGLREDIRESRDNTPREFLNVFDKLMSYSNEKAASWHPEKVEVILVDVNYYFDPYKGKHTLIPWPSGWPNFHSTSVVEDKNIYKVYVDYNQLPEVEQFLKSKKPTDSISIDEKILRIDSLRFPFPSEDIR